jgi:hypothetical protein
MCIDDLNDEIVSGDGCPIYCREADRIAADGHECIGPIIGDHDLCPKVADLKRRDVEEVLAASWVRIEVGDDVGAEGEYERVVAIAALMVSLPPAPSSTSLPLPPLSTSSSPVPTKVCPLLPPVKIWPPTFVTAISMACVITSRPLLA